MSLHAISPQRIGRRNHTKVFHRGRGWWSSLGAAVCSFSPLWETPLCFFLSPTRCRWCLASTSLHLSALTHPSTKPFHSFLHIRQAHYCSGLRRQRVTEGKQYKFCMICFFSCCCGDHGPRIVALCSTFFLCRDLWEGWKMLRVLGQLRRQQRKCGLGSISGQIKILLLQNEK